MAEAQLNWSVFGYLPQQARGIRTAVFIEEQGFQNEFDAIDDRSYHVIISADKIPCGTARIFWEKPTVMRIGRLALCKDARGNGYGRKILEACCEKARLLGAKNIVLDAQKRAKNFYIACGFEETGEQFLDEGYPHYRMEFNLE